MPIFLYAAGVVWVAIGIVSIAGAKGVFHEILGAALISFAVLFWGLARVLQHLKRSEERAEAAAVVQQEHARASPKFRPDPAFHPSARVDDMDIYAPAPKRGR